MADSKNAWPYKQYDGNTAGYEEYATDKETWIIDKGYDKFMRTSDPRLTPRVVSSYRVRNADDPNGRVGEWVRSESEGSYRRRGEAYVEKARKIWAKVMRGYTGQARTTALLAEKYNPKAVFDKVHEGHGDKSDKQVTHLVRDFVGRSKTHGDSIGKFNKDWADAVRIMKANGMELPEKFIVNLYLISLGSHYRTLEAVASVLPKHKRTLAGVMKLAVDHTAADPNEEADHSDHALMALLEKRGLMVQHKRTAEEAFEAAAKPGEVCPICHKPGHSQSECFAPGGGLSGLNYHQRQQWLQQRREKREQDRQKRAKTEGTALSATDDRDARIKELEAQVKQRETQMKTATRRVYDSGVAIDLGFDAEKL